MRRREFITVLGGVAATPYLLWPLAARTQQAGKLRRIGFIFGSTREGTVTLADAFLTGMRQRGYSEGKDFVVDWRFAEGKYERFSEFAGDFVRLKTDVIVLATPSAVRPVQQAAGSIPIVMGYSTDPVGNGFIASLAQPGSNITGLASSLDDITPKHLEFLMTVLPNLSRVGVLMNPNTPTSAPVLTSLYATTSRVAIDVAPAEARSPQEIEDAVMKLSRERVGAVICLPDSVLFAQRAKIAELMQQERLPSIFSYREHVAAGGLMSYGESLGDFYRRAATYVDKIFKGAQPADLPVEQPSRFFLVVNLKTAKALGLTIPESFLWRADEVIE